MAAVLISERHRSFAVPFDKGLHSLVPEARRLEHPETGELLLLPHTRETTRLARNLGYTVPAPILTQYDWNGDTPFRTQRITAAMLTMNSRAYVLSQMGTGKTRAALHALNYLRTEGLIRKSLIVAPLSTLSIVWDREIFQHFNHLSTAILHGTRARRQELLEEDRDVYIINHDGIETVLDQLAARADIDCVIIDELAAFRNARTRRWKAINRVCSARPFVWGLTGSPTPNEPTDAWGQCRLLTPSRVPKYFNQFKRDTMFQLSQFRWKPRAEANDIVYAAMQPGVRYLRDDCVELPDTIYQQIEAPLSTKQATVYKRMMKELSLAFAEGSVTAANEGVLYSKLLQIASGWVYTTDRAVVDLEPSPRLQALEDVLEEADGKVIVFVEFIHTAKRVFEYLKSKAVSCELVTGQTPPSERNRIFTAFQSAAFPRVLVAHPKCMSHGLTLVAANTIVWYGPTSSLETYEQACARITRPGQQKKTYLLHLTGTTVERKLYRRLEQKASVQGALLEMFESQEIDT